MTSRAARHVSSSLKKRHCTWLFWEDLRHRLVVLVSKKTLFFVGWSPNFICSDDSHVIYIIYIIIIIIVYINIFFVKMCVCSIDFLNLQIFVSRLLTELWQSDSYNL